MAAGGAGVGRRCRLVSLTLICFFGTAYQCVCAYVCWACGIHLFIGKKLWSPADIEVSVSGSGRLHSADAALCLTGSGEAPPGTLVFFRSTGHIREPLKNIRLPNNNLTALLVKENDTLTLGIAGEQRQYSRLSIQA